MNVRRACCIIALLVPWISIHAQPWSFTRLPQVSMEALPSDLVAGKSIGYANVGGTVRYTGTQQEFFAWPTLYTRIVASSVDADETMMCILSDGTLFRVPAVGDAENKEGFVYSTRATALVCYDANRTLVARPDALQQFVLVYDLEGLETKSVDTVAVDSVSKCVFYRNADGSITLSMTRIENRGPDTVSYRRGQGQREWTEMSEIVMGAVVVFPDGETVHLPPGGAYTHAVLVDDSVILAMWHIPSTGEVRNFARSDDRGVTFQSVPELDSLVTQMVDIEAWPDGSALISTAKIGLVQWFPDGRILPFKSPKIQVTYLCSEFLPVTSGINALLGTGIASVSPPVYLQNGTWVTLSDDIKSVLTAYAVGNMIHITESSFMWLWDPVMDTVLPIIDAVDNRLESYQTAGVFSIGDSMLVVSSEQWCRVHPNGRGTVLSVKWPKPVVNGATNNDLSAGAVQTANGDILVGRRHSYVRNDSGEYVPSHGLMGIIRTSDLGATWSEASVGLGMNTYIWHLHRGADGLLYCLAGTDQGGPTRGLLYVSSDEGATWTPTPAPLPGAVGGRSPKISVSSLGAITVSGNGIARSADGGQSWVEIRGPWSDSDEGTVTYAVEQPWDHKLVVCTIGGSYISDWPVSVAENVVVSNDPCYTVAPATIFEIVDLRGSVIHRGETDTDGHVAIPTTIPSGRYVLVTGRCVHMISVLR